MSTSQGMKNFNDPLYERLKRKEKRNEARLKSPDETKPKSRTSRGKILGAIAVAAGLGLLTYQLLEAQGRISDLQASLGTSQTQLTDVTSRLDESQQKIGTLEEGFTESQSRLGSQGKELNRYRNLYTGLKSEQEQQTRELQAIAIQKADQSEVEALKGESAEIKQQVTQASSNISDLREMATKNRTDIEGNRENIDAVSQKTDANQSELAGLKHSLEREYYNFELYKKGAIMKVFNVALSLKDIDFKTQRYDLEIIIDGKRVKKEGQHLNEPVYFYVGDLKKPYEIVVSKVDKEYVVGYLSIPKS